METKELTPEYVLQPHAISRAVYRLSATARKLIAMGMAVIPPDLSKLEATFSLFEFCQALGLERSGKHYTLIKEAVRECVRAEITIETQNGWKMFTWISQAEYNDKKNELTLEFSKGLAEYLLELKKMYARLDLMEFGRIQSLYAIRIYEMAKSYESLAGKQGNRENCWFFERKIDEIRKIFGVEDESYRKTNDFRRYVIDKPLKELNEANIGFIITVEYIKKGKFLVGIRFYCEKNIRKVQSRRKKTAEALPAAASDPRTAGTLEAKEAEHLKKLYPEEFAQLYADELEAPHPFLQQTSTARQLAAEAAALKALRDRHGVRR